ncbi:hypothetical protein MKX47_15765 [Solibacillus sp. FSL R7-0668]|uniref:hypothetical protein n=1 Tax=Solibacillus sp. FSL R7-0668 TaxID=2921688 RepID=UPI0030F631F6
MVLARQLEVTEDDYLMMELIEVGLNIKLLENGYYKRYFRKDKKRAWGFKCFHCGDKVRSDRDEAYYIVSIIWKEPNATNRRFCSKDCSYIYFNEEMQMLLQKRERVLATREKVLRG